MQTTGTLIISLDFELYWGMRDKVSLKDYGENILGVRKAIPEMLKLFSNYGIHATWATVGFLFFRDRDELLAGLPKVFPEYKRGRYSPYVYVKNIGLNEKDDPYHFAPSLLELIKKSENQEIGTHTFSHFYCLEDGQTLDAFREDLRAAKRATEKLGIKIKSLVFPRNQMNEKYLRIARDEGIKTYRGNESHWLYAPRSETAESLWRRGLRLVDSYINICSSNIYCHCEKGEKRPTKQSRCKCENHGIAAASGLAMTDVPLELPSSRFFRPYSKLLRPLEPIKLRRIKKAMTIAAEKNEVFHLWWHPHNFGVNQKENFKNLEIILKHFKYLRDKYGMESLSMGEMVEKKR